MLDGLNHQYGSYKIALWAKIIITYCIFGYIIGLHVGINGQFTQANHKLTAVATVILQLSKSAIAGG